MYTSVYYFYVTCVVIVAHCLLRSQDSLKVKTAKLVHRLFVGFEYSSRLKYLYCVAIVAHKWSFVIAI